MNWVNTRLARNAKWAERHMANANWHFEHGDIRQALLCIDHAQEFLDINKGIMETLQLEKTIRRST